MGSAAVGDLAFFLDIDLAILGAHQPLYARYKRLPPPPSIGAATLRVARSMVHARAVLARATACIVVAPA
jgi:hypothetical protein